MSKGQKIKEKSFCKSIVYILTKVFIAIIEVIFYKINYNITQLISHIICFTKSLIVFNKSSLLVYNNQEKNNHVKIICLNQFMCSVQILNISGRLNYGYKG